jgi:glycosyltransferase involved in cell wall biosynthesis
MRVAYLINQYPKVSHSFIRREIQALERQGFEVTRISIRGWNNAVVDEADFAERAKTRYVLQASALALVSSVMGAAVMRPAAFARALKLALSMGWRADRPLPYHLIYLAEACMIKRWLAKSQVRHVHAHFGTNSAEVAMLVHALGGPPFSFTAHGPEEFDRPHAIGLAEKIRRAAFVIAVSSFGRSQLFRLVEHAHWDKIHVVHCGLDTSFFEGDSNSFSNTRNLICVGRLCEQKGQLLLIEAAHQLVKTGTDFTLTLAGDGELRSGIEAMIRQYELGAKVRITGWIGSDEVRQRVLEARALVLPSFAEGLPVAIMEAMALRRPVISTYVGGIPELVYESEHGWLVSAGDADALMSAMQSCLGTPLARIEEMGNAAYARVIKRHLVDTEARKLAELIKGAKPSETACQT